VEHGTFRQARLRPVLGLGDEHDDGGDEESGHRRMGIVGTIGDSDEPSKILDGGLELGTP